ncbi:MAG: aldehyde dehydrogenase (NAD+) [Alteromonadaceae bacterium]|jgi:aldehyde dehydrogenase (NAD+)
MSVVAILPTSVIQWLKEFIMSIREIFQTMEYGPATEDRSAADNWLNEHQQKFNLFINGQWSAPQKGGYFTSVCPANNETLGQIASADAADVDAAVSAAKAALPAWTALGGHGRARYLYAIARQIQKHARLFSVLESLDNGKPIRESRDIDIPLVVRHFYHHAGWAQLMAKELPDHEALGVIGQIIPWNFPMLMLAWKIAPALAMGNTVVLKPAELTSLTALLFAEICQAAGLPDGVLNIVTGAGDTGAALVEHPDVAKIAFTGSTDVGKIIRRATAGSGKKLSLELGGKSPFIVFEDADLDGVVEGVVDAIWFNQGQVCCAGSRILVQESIAERFETKLKARMQTLRIGQPLDKTIDMGALIDKKQFEKVTRMVAQGVAEGGEMFQATQCDGLEGCFFPPTLFSNMSPSATLARDEIFGPVVVSMTFRTPAEAVALANNSCYGLASSIWTENINLALDIAPKVQAGTVWINCTNMFDAAAGFGGYKESGFGREGGKEGLYEYVKEKSDAQLRSQPDALKAQVKTNQEDQETAAKKSQSVLPAIDRTAKLYIGGKQVRPDSGYSLTVKSATGTVLGEVPQGSRKDLRNAVEAANKGAGWGTASAHHRAQVIYYIAENLSARHEEFSANIVQATGAGIDAARQEVDQSIDRLYTYAAMADKYDGAVHATPSRCVTLAMNEPIGVMGVVCPKESALLGFISTVMPAIAMGNRVVAVPSSDYPLVITDFYQILETSDLPAGVINIVTGVQNELAKVLTEHYDVAAIWYFGDAQGSQIVELGSADSMKRTWVSYGKYRDWSSVEQGEGDVFLRQATQVKNIWVPYGE